MSFHVMPSYDLASHVIIIHELSVMLLYIRSWRGGGMRAGSVGEEGGDVVCRVHNGVTVEEHR